MDVSTAADDAQQEEIEQLETLLEEFATELIAKNNELAAIYELGNSTRGVLNMADMLSAVLKDLVKLFQVKNAFGLMIEEGNPIVLEQHAEPGIKQSIIEQWFKTMKEYDRDIVISAAEPGEGIDDDVETALIAPLQIENEIVGALGLINKNNDSFSSADRRRLALVCQQVVVGAENIRLHERIVEQARIESEMRVARDVQARLLPQTVPSIQGLNIAALSEPALEVGGDFYDFIKRDNNLVFTVGDVSGKGMPAALLMAMTRTSLRNMTRISADNSSVAHLLQQVNEALYDDYTEVNMFATMFVARYEPVKRQLTYANAGHSPVLFCPAGGKTRMLEAEGVPVGVLDDCFASDQTLQLNPGDLLIITSDGLPEAENDAREMYGYERMMTWMESAAENYTTAKEIQTALLDDVLAFANESVHGDDKTVIVLLGGAD